MKLGFSLAALVIADGHGKPGGHDDLVEILEGADFTGGSTPEPTPAYNTSPHTDYPDYPDYTTGHHNGGHYTPNPTARPNTGRPQNGRPQTERPQGGNSCNAAAMKQWKMAMEHWKEQQRDWEHHFQMWKDQQGDSDHEYPSGYDEDYSGDYHHGDYHDKYPDQYPSDQSGMDIWSMLMPIFDYMNSPDFCELFYLLPSDWEPEAWAYQCKENQKVQKMIESIIEQMMYGQLNKYEYADKMCYTVGKTMIDAFKSAGMNDWAMHVEWAEDGCKCMNTQIYDLVMGNDVDWMTAFNCGQTWYELIMKMTAPYMPIDETFYRLPEGAETLVRLWVKDQKEVNYWLEYPREAVMEKAAEWGISGNDLVDGLRNWETLVDQYDAKLEILGFFDKDVRNMTYSDVSELFEYDQTKIDMFYGDPAEKHSEELSEDETWLVEQWGVLDLFTNEAFRDPWGYTDGTNNFVLSARAYVEAMKAFKKIYDRFVPGDHFLAMMMYAGRLREMFEGQDDEDNFVKYAFDNYELIWQRIESWAMGEYDHMDGMNHMDGKNPMDGMNHMDGKNPMDGMAHLDGMNHMDLIDPADMKK